MQVLQSGIGDADGHQLLSAFAIGVHDEPAKRRFQITAISLKLFCEIVVTGCLKEKVDVRKPPLMAVSSLLLSS
jgi:hypothetical protein